MHDLAERAKRMLAGSKRKEAMSKMKSVTASIFRRKNYGHVNTDKVMLEKGNYTEVQTLDVLLKARQEVLSANF